LRIAAIDETIIDYYLYYRKGTLIRKDIEAKVFLCKGTDDRRQCGKSRHTAKTSIENHAPEKTNIRINRPMKAIAKTAIERTLKTFKILLIRGFIFFSRRTAKYTKM
jgi:hypothetical protein